MPKIEELILWLSENKGRFFLSSRFPLKACWVPLMFSLGCVTSRPSLEYVLAEQAFLAAREVDSARYAPGLFHKAEESYRHGVSYYQNQQYSKAVKEFQAARVFAEKAENFTRIQRQKTGDESL